MNKLIGLLVVILAFLACESEVKFNDPGFQAQRLQAQNESTSLPMYEYWKATEYSAEVRNGAIFITGSDGYTTLEFYVGTYDFGSRYDFGVLESDKAILFEVDDDGDYIGPIYEINGSLGSGYITFDPVERQIPGTISGTFNVTLFGDSGEGRLKKTYNKGVFYRIPLTEAKQ